ncbi:MAG TPA: Uma2 family endonuclease [Chthoniobacteraceae bacterium]
MATLTIELRAGTEQTAFNLHRWSELLEDAELGRELARFRGRIETDRHGHIVMYPPPGYAHGGFQAEIAHQLRDLLPAGRVTTECPVSTADGVKGVDVTWVSDRLRMEIDAGVFLSRAPEICVEVISPSNTRREMAEKKALFFAAGATEVWFCAEDGRMTFFLSAASRGAKSSRLCPAFPGSIKF